MASQQLVESTRRQARRRAVADDLRPLMRALLGTDLPVRVEFWDGSAFGPERDVPALRVMSPDTIRRVAWSPDELGFGRAYVAGEIDTDDDLYDVLRRLRPAGVDLRTGLKTLPAALGAARRLRLLGPPPPPPPEEANQRGRRHSKARDAQAISHHYDVGNDFYRLVLGPAMTYSCAFFAEPGMSLVDAQAAKHERICRKLGLHERRGMRLLDIGCGWGSMAIHAAQHHGAHAVGITISREQAERARQRVTEAGLDGLVEIRLQDYRDLAGEQFDAVSSVGMFEHVGAERMAEYFTIVRSLLLERGRLLNHAISAVGGSKLGRRSFVGRYVFPDGELIDVGEIVLAMEKAGFEVRDVESLREHYALTLREWVANLEANWDEATRLAGPARARIWRLYMASSAIGFEDGGLGIHQTLGVVPDQDGNSGMPRSRPV